MNNEHDLELILNSQVPLIVVETHDEPPMLELLKRVSLSRNAADYQPVFRWTITDGLQRMELALQDDTEELDPEQVLRHIRRTQQTGIYVLLDFHPYLKDPVNIRLLKDICIDFPQAKRHVVLLSHQLELPPELEAFGARFHIALPNERQRNEIIREVASEWREAKGKTVSADPRALELLVTNLAGLTESDTRRLARNAIFNDGAITRSDLEGVMAAKYELLNRGGVLGFEYETHRFSDVAGLSRLKAWLEQRKPAFLGEAQAAGLDVPRGVLLIGVQGCGKSLTAKATAGVYGVPLLRLDFGTLYNKYHGESERNLRESLKTAEVMAPCVLWIDEIEKGLSTGHDSTGTTRRVLGTFLTWLAEKNSPVFVVATANDISALPPELVRKGRFDELFFVDLPDSDVRMAIFEVHLRFRGHDPAAFDLARLEAAADGFSGAEIEQGIVSALYAAHAKREPLSTAHILRELERTQPLSVVMAETVHALRSWADGRTVPGH